MGDYHVRFRERLGVKLPLSTRPRWKCQYHIVFIPKYRKKVLYGLWARGYYVETVGNITDEAVQKYIKEQAEESRKEDTRSTAF